MLKILLLEDKPFDAALIDRVLKKGKIKSEILVVENRVDFENALKYFLPDIILADHSLPTFNSVDALKIVQKSFPQIPFILVTATVSEEFAIETMQAGAYDYIFKDRLQRLPKSVLNAISKSRIEDQRKKYLEEVIASEASLKQLNESLEMKISERIAQLEKANIELESFGFSVSHDLKTPLTVIQTSAAILEMKIGNKLQADEAKLLEKIQNNALSMGTLINDLLSLSKYNRSGEIEKELVFMNKMVTEVTNELQPTYPNAKIQVEGIVSSYGNPGLIRQVWINLISNALKYSANKLKPEIKISATRHENEIVYFVEDNGPGFEIEDPSKLFDLFHRFQPHQGFSGHGIGLAIVKRIIEKHGGRVWAQGKAGVGASFFFSLPITIPA
jgi:two-component system sensor histidine kinase/response regulator